MSSGTVVAQSARWSTKSSSPSSAQWRSSNTSTSGRCSAAASSSRRQAANASSRSAAFRAFEPDERPRVPDEPVALRLVLASDSTIATSFSSAVAASSDSRIPACALTISPSAQKLTRSP